MTWVPKDLRALRDTPGPASLYQGKDNGMTTWVPKTRMRLWVLGPWKGSSGAVTARLRGTAGVGRWAQHPTQLEALFCNLAAADWLEVGISEWGMWPR